MKVILMSMPDVAPLIIHETAIHMPGHGIACSAAMSTNGVSFISSI